MVGGYFINCGVYKICWNDKCSQTDYWNVSVCFIAGCSGYHSKQIYYTIRNDISQDELKNDVHFIDVKEYCNFV